MTHMTEKYTELHRSPGTEYNKNMTNWNTESGNMETMMFFSEDEMSNTANGE